MFGALYAAEGTPPGALADVAREFSPRIDIGSQPDRDVALDLSGLERLFGDARTIAEELRRTAADRGLRVRVAITGTRTASRLLVRYRAGLTIVGPGNEAAAVAPLPITLLGDLITADETREPRTSHLRTVNSRISPPERRIPSPGSRIPSPESRVPDPESRVPELATFRRWGLRTLGDLAALPADDLAARLGRHEIDWP